ncbi:MAG: DUF3782 domain-containing protein [Anaerolineales bacterium]
MEESIREIIQRELPALVMKDPQIRDWVWRLIHEYAPDKVETESRFEQMLAELHAMRDEFQREMATMRDEFQREMATMRDEFQREMVTLRNEFQHKMATMREESERRWAENQRWWAENQQRWEEFRRQWEENQRRWEENERRWEENEHRWEEFRRQWEENQRRWEENERRWEENQEIIQKLLKRDEKIERRIDSTIGAIGARWGVATEASFRNALKGILEESFGVKVERVEYWDDKGEVYDRPDQVELDVIIRNGQVLACEIKASASRSDIYTFNRKVSSYEKRTQRKVDRKLLISPMVTDKDKELARSLGIEVYSDAEQVVP